MMLIRFYHSFAFKILIFSYVFALVAGLGISLFERQVVEQALVASIAGQEMALLEYEEMRNEDQFVKNASLSAQMAQIQSSFEDGASLFEERADLAVTGANIKALDVELAGYLRFLSERKWEEAKEKYEAIESEINQIKVASIPKVATEAVVASSNELVNGYSRQKVKTEQGEFVVSLVVAPGARAQVETASDSDCGDNCPTRSLAEHISMSGGFAGINGAYFCPPDYPRCQGKTNTFDTLAVNGRSKAILNQANNTYSTVPLVAFYGSSLSFYDQTLQWGADTSSGGGIANYPRLLRDGSLATTQNNGKGTRGFIGVKDGAIVMGHIYNASFGESALVLQTLGLSNALNLDGGGSSALWYEGGYKVGPGRSLPTAIVLLR